LRRREPLKMTSPLGTRDKNTRRQQELIALRKAHAKSKRRRGIAISAVGLAVASAVVTVMMPSSRPTSSSLADQSPTSPSDMQGISGDMPGIDMSPGPTDLPAAKPTPNPHSSDMPG
jgi:hypothetical protein